MSFLPLCPLSSFLASIDLDGCESPTYRGGLGVHQCTGLLCLFRPWPSCFNYPSGSSRCVKKPPASKGVSWGPSSAVWLDAAVGSRSKRGRAVLFGLLNTVVS